MRELRLPVGLTLVLTLAAILLLPAVGNAQGVLFVVDNKVGIGTDSPNAPLEIAPSSGNAAFRLTFPAASTWTISNTGEIVTFNKIGTGGQEVTFRERNDVAGTTLAVQGSVSGTTFINTSSRALKTGFADVAGREVLSQLMGVPVTSWRYKTEPDTARHLGPVAEDFQAAFGLGDGKTISTVDAQGVAFAAIKGLHELILERDGEIEALRQELALLRQLVESR